jgi:hypothetical protein
VGVGENVLCLDQTLASGAPFFGFVAKGTWLVFSSPHPYLFSLIRKCLLCVSLSFDMESLPHANIDVQYIRR